MTIHHTNRDPRELIAVVGMAGRFPGAPEVDGLWDLLMAGGDAIRPVPADRWDAAALDDDGPVQSVGGFIDGVDQFDAAFFGISPREAEEMDPQQRLMLEVAWRALEDAGRSAASLRCSRTGVYVGASWHDYEIVRRQRGARATQHTGVGNALDVIAARLSYFFQLKGPSLTVETGCSSSLVALHLACQALRTGEIEGAFVGGVNLILAPDVSVALQRFGGLSPDGRCKTFAAAADGFVRGEGAIAVYVKTLDRALTDGDRIHAVIVGTAVNNDGGGASLVTPSPAGQDELLSRAYAESGVPADDVAYVEAHGTGTAVGDPIEVGAIGRAIGQKRASGPLAIGSLKTNIGHLEAAAGLAGFVKAVLSLERGVVPPSLHSDVLNPAIPFDELNLRVVREPLQLPADRPICAGVSSFGWGGTNAHVILRSAPPAPAALPRDPSGAARPIVVPLSAHSDEALRQRAADLRAFVADGSAPIEELAATLGCKRDHFARRAAFVVENAAELESHLASFAADPAGQSAGVVTGATGERGRTAFVFPGQGSQWLGMGRDLFAASPTFAAVIRRCASALAPHVGWDLAACIAGEAGTEWPARVDMLQPILWATSVALAELWREAGVEPDVVVGHSQGEVAAATIAGILSYEDAARIVARRSQIVRRKSGQGAMLAVDLDAAQARAALAGFEDSVSLAVHNGPTSCVLSGDAEAIATLAELLEVDGTFCRPVQVDYASHSPHMDELRADLLAALDGIAPAPGNIPLVSTVVAERLDGAELDASYWVRNLRETVRFAEAVEKLLADGVTHIVEVSPHPVLAPALEKLAASRPTPAGVLTTLRRNAGTERDFAQAIARAFAAGLSPFRRAPGSPPVQVPAYPWQRKRHWVAPAKRRDSLRAGLELDLVPELASHGSWQSALAIGVDDEPWLQDHKVHGAVVLPATAMMALALRTARARSGSLPSALVDVRFHRDLTLGDEPARAMVSWRDDLAEGGSFSLLSLAAGTTAWTEHVTARVHGGAAAAPRAAFPDHLAALTDSASSDEFYADCAARGLDYGPAFRGVVRVSVDGAEALGKVRLPEVCRAGARWHGLHPALWDAALQVCLPLCPADQTVVPTAAARITWLQEPSEPVALLWSHAVRRDSTRFDLVLFDRDRQPLMAIEGLTLEPLAVSSSASDADRVHRLCFQEEARGDVNPTGATWAVCGDAAGARALVEALGDRARHVSPAQSDAPAWLDALRQAGDAAGVVFVAPRASAGVAAQRRGLHALTELVKACASLASRATPPRLVVVTADAQAAVEADQPDPGAALYWGFARVVRREHPELRPLIVDVRSADMDWAARCAAEALAAHDEDQVVLRGEQRLVGRLVRGEVASDRAEAPRAWTTPAQPFRLHVARPGLSDGLEFRPLSRRAPAAGEIEVEVDATALNFIDTMKAMGTYPGAEGTAAQLGGECAGRVVAVGPGVTSVTPGDRVVACAFGSAASHVTVRADHAQPIPADMDDRDAAGLPLVLTTAWYGLHELARLSAGESVLIHSAAGGLGLAAIQVAKSLGARIIATAGSEEKRRYLRSLGIADVFDSRGLAWVDGVRAATDGRGVDVVLNSLTGAAIPLGLDALAEDGRFIEVGKQDIHAGRSLRLAAFKKGISFAAVDLAGLMERRPERFARSFAAAWAAVRGGAIRPLPATAYAFADAADAIHAMARGNHIGKLVLTSPDTVQNIAPEPMPDQRFRADATYLITGGLGALGLSLAEFMAERGAGALALAGRSAPDAEATCRIEALRARGVHVETCALDVSDARAVDSTLDRVRRTMPTLRGVVHAAGLLDDATVANLTAEQLERVLAPKVDGARHLDAATSGDPLDLFVMFSSAAALVGNAGQSAYAAGNAFLDALAEARRRRGRPALSVQWGPFDDVGLAAQDDRRGARLAERGMGGFSTGEAWSALVRFLHGDDAVVGYVSLDLRRWFDAYPETAAQKTWQALREQALEGRTTVGGDAFRKQLEASPEAARHDLAVAKVRELASRVLRLDVGEVERETPFKALGLDSLMGLELRNRLESAFGLELSPTLLWTYGSARALAGALCERVVAQAA
jgi:phthiocerol/phenolphthiocerol synthesis type-I polyketide synthase C